MKRDMLFYNPRTEQYLVPGDKVTFAEGAGADTGIVHDFLQDGHNHVFVDVVVGTKTRTLPIEEVVLCGSGKLARIDMSATTTTSLIYTMIDLHESRYFHDFRAATKDEREAYVEAIEEEINRRIPPRMRIGVPEETQS